MFGVFSFGVPSFGDAVVSTTTIPPVPPPTPSFQTLFGGGGHRQRNNYGPQQKPDNSLPGRSDFAKVLGALSTDSDDQDVADVTLAFLAIKDRRT